MRQFPNLDTLYPLCVFFIILVFRTASTSENTRFCLVVVGNEMRREKLPHVLKAKGSNHTKKLGLYCEGLSLKGEGAGEVEKEEMEKKRKGLLFA